MGEGIDRFSPEVIERKRDDLIQRDGGVVARNVASNDSGASVGMPWVLIRGALRNLRKAAELDRKAAAQQLGLSEWTLHRHEDPKLAPAKLRDYIVKIYVKGYNTKADTFVKWRDHGDESEKRGRRIKDPAAPKIQTLTERAQHEQAIKGQQTIEVRGERIEVVGPDIIQECIVAFGIRAGNRLAVSGLVSDTKYLPEPAAKAIGAKLGEGASFRIDREVAKGLPVYVSVFTKRPEDTRYLLDAHKAKRPVTVIVKVFVKESDQYWKGLFIFEKKPIPRPWIFLVDEIVP